MLTDFQRSLIAKLESKGFRLVANPSQVQYPHPNMVVLGKLVKRDITLRVYIAPSNPIMLGFVAKNGNRIKPVGSTRWANQQDRPTPERALSYGSLDQALIEWPLQLARTDILCNKCIGTGEYHLEMKNGKQKGVICNRCSGNGLQNYNHQIANERYDFIHHKRQAAFEDDNGGVLKPHWVPYEN